MMIWLKHDTSVNASTIPGRDCDDTKNLSLLLYALVLTELLWETP